MAKVIVGQAVKEPGTFFVVEHPSRVVAALAVIKAPANQAFGYTSQLGNRLRLRKVRVWFMPVWTGAGEDVHFWVHFGGSAPATYVAMSNWEDVLPIYWLGAGPFGYGEFGTGQVFEWTMDRLFIGEAIRFGIRIEVSPLIVYEEMYATFEIMEG